MHSDRKHRAALTSVTGYIVVFKKTVSKAEIQKWKDQIVQASEYLILHTGTNLGSQRVRDCHSGQSDARI